MVQVAPIKLKVGPKVLWFDPAGIDVKADDHVIVSTERGHEYGVATSDVIEISDELVAGLKSPLKPVLRLATPEDEETLVELEQRGEEALLVFRRLAEETHTDMHPVAVEFLFDGDKAVFFFESEERVDFRELVRRLAGEFHVRVDMRQIGVRDAARMIGGLGHCGQELCCRRMGGDFNPVTIRMAKEQGLSLNPQKISGCCGRLMCCLRYEFETYKEFNSRAPKMNAKVEVPGGIAKVTDVSMPTETIALRLEDGKTIRVPLAEFEEPEEGRRPHVISEEVFERYTQDDSLEKLSSGLFGEVVGFTGEEKLADPTRRPRPRSSKQEEKSERTSRSSSRKPRRRSSDGRTRGAESAERGSSSEKGSRQDRRERRGDEQAKRSRRQRGASQKSGEGQAQASRQPQTHRKRRRRSSVDGASLPAPAAASMQTQADSSAPKAQKPGPKPGHRSSALRNVESAPSSTTPKNQKPGQKRNGRRDSGKQGKQGKAPASAKASASQKGSSGGKGSQAPRQATEHRKPRRRRNNQEGSSNATE